MFTICIGYHWSACILIHCCHRSPSPQPDLGGHHKMTTLTPSSGSSPLCSLIFVRCRLLRQRHRSNKAHTPTHPSLHTHTQGQKPSYGLAIFGLHLTSREMSQRRTIPTIYGITAKANTIGQISHSTQFIGKGLNEPGIEERKLNSCNPARRSTDGSQ